jgi:AmiR/NasT family two-component response regulator
LEAVRPPEVESWPDDAVVIVRRLAQDVALLRERTQQLEHALESRIVIEQAKGVLAERLEIGPDEAFEVLRRAARSAQIRLHDLAREVVAAPTTPPPVAREIARRRRREGAR